MQLQGAIKRIFRRGRPGGKINFRRPQPALAVLGLLLVSFAIFASFFALHLKRGIIPDENHHFALSLHYADTWGIPPDSPETYQYGYMGHRPYLYYWINGRVINILRWIDPAVSEWRILAAIRLLNVFYSALAVIFVYLTGKEILGNRWQPLLAVFMLTNTLMFVFLSGGVNYDNLVNLLCFAGVFFLVRVLNGKPFYPNSLGWLISMTAGALVKVTALPLAAVTGLVWLAFALRCRRGINFRPVVDWKLAASLAAAAVLLALNLSLWGGNIIRYRSLTPACRLVLTEEQCRENAVVRREDRILLPVKLTLQDILRGGSGISDPAEWFFDYWIPTILTKIYGVMGHKTYYPDLIVTFYRLLYLGVFLAAVRYWQRPSFALGGLAALALFYIPVLAWTNYTSELQTGFRHVAIQGRYIFPIIGVIYVLMVYSIFKIPSRWVRGAAIALAAALFAWGSPPAAMLQSRPAWVPARAVLPEKELTELAGGAVISQDFVSQCDGTIDRIEFLLKPGEDAGRYALTLHLTDSETGRVVTNMSVSGQGAAGFQWYRFDTPALTGSFGKSFRLTLSAPETPPGSGLTAWGSAANAHEGSLTLVNGEPADSSLVFRYQCRKRPFDGWFN